jgi:hypothetical protein
MKFGMRIIKDFHENQLIESHILLKGVNIFLVVMYILVFLVQSGLNPM